MCVTLVGGIDRLKPNYIRSAKQRGITLKCLLHDEPNFKEKIGNPDALVIFTNQISHEARRKAVEHAKAQNIELRMLHGSSVSALCNCLCCEHRSACDSFSG